MIEAAKLVNRYRPGTPVEVHCQYTDGWTRGFCIAESLSEGYRLRRQSDGATLPMVFAPEDVRGPMIEEPAPAAS